MDVYFFVTGLIVALAVLSFAPVLYWLYPKPIFYLLLRYGHLLTGLKRKFLKTKSGFTFCYYERTPTTTAGTNTPPTLVFLHGYTANKIMWLQTAKLLPKEWGMVIPDLPGHGESSFKTKADYSPRSFVEKINDFVEALGLKDFHLVGMSMGALLSATFAAAYPHKLQSLTLMCMGCLEHLPGGRATKVWTQLEEEGDKSNILLPESEAEVKLLLETVTYSPKLTSKIHSGIRKAYVDIQLPHYPAFREIFKETLLGCDPKALADDLSKITVPVFIVWGANDELCHPAGAKVLSSILKESKVLMLERCGHLLPAERLRKSVYATIDFIKETVII